MFQEAALIVRPYHKMHATNYIIRSPEEANRAVNFTGMIDFADGVTGRTRMKLKSH
jgi:hypothetical protein